MYPQLPIENINETLKSLPKPLVAGFYSDNVMDMTNLAGQFGLEENEAASLGRIYAYAFLKLLPLAQMHQAIKSHVKNTEQSRDIAFALLERMYPYWPFFPDIDDIAVSLEKKLPKEKPPLPEMHADSIPEFLKEKPAQKTEAPEAIEEEGPNFFVHDVLKEFRDTLRAPIKYPVPPANPMHQEPQLFGGIEIPMPPMPRETQQTTNNPSTEFGASKQQITGLERDIPWSPQTLNPIPSRSVARPGDVARLLDANILKKPSEDVEPKIKGNVVDLSN